MYLGEITRDEDREKVKVQVVKYLEEAKVILGREGATSVAEIEACVNQALELFKID